jgi:hypothetical protein
MKQKYLLGVEVLNPSRQLVGYAVLEFKPGSVRLVTHRMIGLAIGGALLALCTSAYFGAIITAFLIFPLSPITKWNPLFGILFAIGMIVGGLVILFTGARFLLPQVEVRYPKTIREPKIVETRLSDHELVVQLDGQDFVLSVSSSTKGLLTALSLAGLAERNEQTVH